MEVILPVVHFVEQSADEKSVTVTVRRKLTAQELKELYEYLLDLKLETHVFAHDRV